VIHGHLHDSPSITGEHVGRRPIPATSEIWR
jgi:hypothetical protein